MQLLDEGGDESLVACSQGWDPYHMHVCLDRLTGNFFRSLIERSRKGEKKQQQNKKGKERKKGIFVHWETGNSEWMRVRGRMMTMWMENELSLCLTWNIGPISMSLKGKQTKKQGQPRTSNQRGWKDASASKIEERRLPSQVGESSRDHLGTAIVAILPHLRLQKERDNQAINQSKHSTAQHSTAQHSTAQQADEQETAAIEEKREGT